jgi:hypothetical protein
MGKILLVAMMLVSTSAAAEPRSVIDEMDQAEKDTAMRHAEREAAIQATIQREVDEGMKAWREKHYGQAAVGIAVFGWGFVRGITLGAADLLSPHDQVGIEMDRANPRASTAGTVVGFIALVFLAVTLCSGRYYHWRYRRALRKLRGSTPTTEEPGVVGWFETRDGYEFAVVRVERGGRKTVLVRGPREADAAIVN